MILIASVAFVFRRTLRRSGQIVGYVLAVAAAFALFIGFFKWQPWNSRLHLPLFFLFMPFVAMVVLQWRGRRQVVYLMALFIVGSMPWVLVNQTRSLVHVFRQHESILVESRTDQYFQRFAIPLRKPYLATADFFEEHQIKDIGLVLPYDPFEYQLWVLLKRVVPDVRLKHIEVPNASAALKPPHDFTPAAIIRVRSSVFPLPDGNLPRNELRTAGGLYRQQWSMDDVEVFVRQP